MRYFFNLAGAVHDPDNLGCELENMSAARIMAAREVALTIRDRPEIVWMGEEVRLEVTDANQLVLFTVIVMGVNSAAGMGSA